MAACCIALYLVACSGFSLPVPIPASSIDPTNEPYPCQHHRCGCNSAAQCWNHCCCMTPQRRLAWARENRVTPPADWLARMSAEKEASRATCASGCCQKHHAHDGEAHPDETIVRATCRSTPPAAEAKRSCCSHAAGPSARPASARVKWVNMIEAQKCSGQMQDWLSGGASTLPPQMLQVEMADAVCWVEPSYHPLPHAPPLKPDVPPPRPFLH